MSGTEKTNRTPWCDVVKLLTYEKQEDEAGFVIPASPTEREVFCTFVNGVSRAEYYEGAKAGVRVAASVEVWEDDYERERRLVHENIMYEIGRVYPTGRGTLILYLSEVVR